MIVFVYGNIYFNIGHLLGSCLYMKTNILILVNK